MLETPRDRLEEWLSVPSPISSPDSRFAVKQAVPETFDRVFDCVDESFGRTRPRVLYDWLYRRNPYGRAWIWYLEEVSTGRMLKTEASLPWPTWLGETPRVGFFGGDAGTVPDWQRKGLTRVLRTVKHGHPWHLDRIVMGGPNKATLAVQGSMGRAQTIRGMIPGGVAVLTGGALLQRAGLPNRIAQIIGTAAGPALDLWRGMVLPRSRALHFESLARFTSDMNTVTWETMRFPHYWCPHNAEWLNWRYLDHPTEPYSAFVLLEPRTDRPLGYSVVRLAGEQATLSEFAAPPEHAPILLRHTIAATRSAGCSYMNFFSPPQWRHWGLFRRAGFFSYRTKNYFSGSDKTDEDRSHNFDRWQLTPGDRDLH